MEISRKDEELLAYRVIELSSLPSQLLLTSPEKHSDVFLSFMDGKVHGAVELRGDGDLFSVLFFFLWLRRTAPEVCYRSKLGEPGAVIFSIYDRTEKLRPVWLQEMRGLSEEEKRSVEEVSKQIPFGDGKMNIASVWQKMTERFPEASIPALIELFDVMIQDQRTVFLEGAIPVFPALFVANYLIATHRTLVWNGMTIQ